MRVGLVIYGSLDTVSGGYLYDRQLVDHLQKCGDEVDVISLPPRRYSRHLLDNFSAKFINELTRTNYDVLLQDELNHPSLFLLNQTLKQRTTCPIVSIVHHLRCKEARSQWQNAFYQSVERKYLLSVDGMVYNSQTTCDVSESVMRVSKPHVIANPAGNRLINHLEEVKPRDSAELRILFVGNVIPRKGLHVLLDALANLEPTQFEARIAGNSELDLTYRQVVSDQILDYRLLNRVHIIGRIPDEKLAEQYEWADVLVVPSSNEGFGIVYLEAMRFGVPAIATTSGAAKEIITHGRNGFLIEPDNAYDLSQHLKQLYLDRPLLARMSNAAKKRYADYPTWATSMSRIRAFLQRMTSVQHIPAWQPAQHITSTDE